MTSCESLGMGLLSGYLDHELTQGEAQKVRIHLENCAECNALYEDMKNMREVSMNTRFKEPRDHEWNELPKTVAGGFMRRLGWLIVIIWAVLTVGFTLWQIAASPENLLIKVLIFGGLSGFTLLFISVVLDRLKAAKNDPYRKVDK